MLGTSTYRQPSRGFGLVESLVALSVLAVGVLGTLGALLAGLRASRAATNWTIASQLAADLADCIRSNPTAGPAYSLGLGTVPPTPPKDCRWPVECSPTDVAALDLHRWHAALRAALPDATAVIAVRATGASPANEYTIVIRWRPADVPGLAEIALAVQS
jgi:type IV pilus assembly protein PilV